MHEVGLIADAIKQAENVAQQAGAVRIERLTFSLTADSHVTREAVETLFTVLSRGTLAEGACVIIEARAASCYCLACEAGFPASERIDHSFTDTCPLCGEPGIPDHQGADLILTSIDVVD